MSLELSRAINIQKFLPAVTDRINSVLALTAAENTEFATLWNVLCDIFNNQFITYATENGLKQWEKMLDLVPKATDSLDDRRFRILTFLKGNRPYTYKKLCDLLDELCGTGGYEITTDFANYSMTFKLNLGVKSQLESAEEMLERIVPKNILLTITLNFNRHIDIKALYTHAQCAQHTHQSLREDVLT